MAEVTIRNHKDTLSNIGRYAISTVSFDDINDIPVTSISKGKKGKGVKEVIYPIFLEYGSSISDEYWISKLKDASIGKFPKGFSCKDNCLIYKKGNKTFVNECLPNPIQGAKSCIEFFHIRGGLSSPEDERYEAELRSQRIEDALNEPPLTWANSNKKIQECLLYYFIDDMKQVMNLSKDESTSLKEILILGISDKYFGKNNITVVDNRIVRIDGLLFDDDSREFVIDPNISPSGTRSSKKKSSEETEEMVKKDETPHFYAKWKKYIDAVAKEFDYVDSRMKRKQVSTILGEIASSNNIDNEEDLYDQEDYDNDSDDNIDE